MYTLAIITIIIRINKLASTAMSSESIPARAVSKKRKWLDGRRERKTPGLIQSDLLKTGSVHPQNTGDIQYSENWRTLSQVTC